MANSAFQRHIYARQTADGFITIDSSRLISVLLFGGSDATVAVLYDVGTPILDVNVPANASRQIDLENLGGIHTNALWLDITGTNAVALASFSGRSAIATNVSSAQTVSATDNGKGYTITANANTHRLPGTGAISTGFVVAFWNKSAGDNTILVPVAQLGTNLVLNESEAPADGVILNQNEAAFFKYDGAHWIARGTGAATTV